jgi:4-methylaminobutanoate oxidase (formaldehyde-forming)
LTTRPDSDHPVDRLSPAIRDRQNRIYSRPESGGLIVGTYEAEPVEYDTENLRDDFDMSAMKAARDDLNVAMLIQATQQRFPWINERTPMTITKGIMTFTPDGKPFCGKMPAIEGLYHCAGFSGHGIVQSPTIGLIRPS